MPLGPAALPALIQDSTAQTSEVESLRGWWFSFVGCLLGPSVKASIETIMSLRKETAAEEEVVLLGLQSLPLGKMFLHVVGLFDALFKLGLDKL